MASTSIPFAGDRIALIVRGKTSETHSPKLMEQHADCVRSDGSPIGYFGEGGVSSGTSAASSGGTGYLSSGLVVGLKGEVYDLGSFQINRPYYVDCTMARTANVISTALVIAVANGEATKFDEYWMKLKDEPGTFSLLGRNCSTRASGAFRYAEILAGGIPGLDTPNNLYRQLRAERADRCTSYSGYVGFETAGNGFSLRIEGL